MEKVICGESGINYRILANPMGITIKEPISGLPEPSQKIKEILGYHVDGKTPYTHPTIDGRPAKTDNMNKEDIISAGWKHLGGFSYYYPYNTYLDEFSNRQISWRLNFVDNTRYMRIEAYERNSFDWETVYCGPCKTNETFEYLMSLFCIKPTEDLQEIEIFKK